MRKKKKRLINVFIWGCEVMEMIGFIYMKGWELMKIEIIKGIGKGGIIEEEMMVIVMRYKD